MLKALLNVQSALADGHNVEERRLRLFCSECKIDISRLSNENLTSLAAGFEVAMYALVGDELSHDHRHLVDSTTLRQEFICRGLIQYLEEKGISCTLDDQTLRATFPSLISGLGCREALIYREWQDAIGDVMIAKDELSTIRKYRIIGFEEFTQLMKSGTFDWIEPFQYFIEDVDFERIDPADERPKHLRDLAKGVAMVLISISDSSQSALVNDNAVKRARDILQILKV